MIDASKNVMACGDVVVRVRPEDILTEQVCLTNSQRVSSMHDDDVDTRASMILMVCANV